MMTPLRAAGLTLAIGIAAAATPACATRESVDRLRRDVDTLQRENFQLRKDLTEARVRLEMQKEQAAPAASRTAPPADTVPLAGAGRAAASSAQPAATSNAPRVIYSEPITEAPRRGGPEGSRASSGPSSLLGAGREALDAKDPGGALALFQQVVDRYPADALADDAQFGVGECYFQMGRYEEAIAEYQKVANVFPFGDQVPFAFLKIGFSHLAREQRDLALDSFRTVSEAYPGTEAATVARQQIAHLKASVR